MLTIPGITKIKYPLGKKVFSNFKFWYTTGLL